MYFFFVLQNEVRNVVKKQKKSLADIKQRSPFRSQSESETPKNHLTSPWRPALHTLISTSAGNGKYVMED